METVTKTFRQRINQNLKTNKVIDNLIYKFSGKETIYETLQFKTWLLINKTKYVSDFAPIVIGGCPRSGTTLVRALIGRHPEIASPKREYNILIGLKNDDILQSILDFSPEEITELKHKQKNIVSFSEKVLQSYMQKKGKQHIAVKQPFHILFIDELFRYFPNMKFIHVIRDGRDVACSLRIHPKWKIVNGKIAPTHHITPFDWCIRRWVICVSHGKKWRKSDNYLEIKYEDLVASTVDTMKKLFRFLRVKMISKEELLSFYKYEKDEDHLQNIEVGKSIYEKSIGRWKKEMSEDEKERFKHMAGKLLIDLKYEEDTNW